MAIEARPANHTCYLVFKQVHVHMQGQVHVQVQVQLHWQAWTYSSFTSPCFSARTMHAGVSCKIKGRTSNMLDNDSVVLVTITKADIVSHS